MATPTIQFRDSIGNVTITAQGLALNNWLPDVDEIGDRQTPVGTGLEAFWRYRRDFWASFEMGNIPAANLANLHRLKSHLLTGGLITVNTNDAASRVYTCSIKPGATPSWSFSDRTMCEYTLSLEVRNVMPYPMVCDYSSFGGTTGNLIVNGDGETGSNGETATGWTNDAGDALKITNGQAMFGSKSLKHANIFADGTTNQHAAQTFTLTPSQRYLYAGWVKVDGVAGDFGQILVLSTATSANITPVAQYSKTFTAASGLISKGTITDWGYAALLFDGPASGDCQALIFTTSTGSASAWYDGLRLEPVPKV